MPEAEALCLRIRATLEANGLARLRFPVELLARESLANAINHGNRRDVDKEIELHFTVGREWIRLEVGDQGPGFAWRKRLRRKANRAACSGRGLELYSLYADRVRFNRRGNRITLWLGRKQI
jgi:anti-sigma regulatory factor (Ser/Thr protein kinase)